MRLLISDANILIDMEDGSLVEALFRLPYRFMTPDILFMDELDENHGYLLKCGLQLGELHPDSVGETERLAESYPGPSRYDCLALALARQEKCPLLTGDRHLRQAAEQELVRVAGTLWLVEQMTLKGLITLEQARLAYAKMRKSGSRLPWGKADAHLLEIEQGIYMPQDLFCSA